MSEARKFMAGVIRSHDYGGSEQDPIGGRRVEHCGCGWRSTFVEREHSDHVAAEIDKALGGLAREEMEGMRVGDDPRLEPYRESRWVSGWTEAPHG